MKLFHGFHDFIYIDDFVRGIDILINTDNKPLGDIVNFGSGEQYSNHAVSKLFEQVSGVIAPIQVVQSMAKEFESDVWICDTAYAERQYGFKTQVSLKEGIEKLLGKNIDD
jgi:nucleoside-diphosphate-sugar epimerase